MWLFLPYLFQSSTLKTCCDTFSIVCFPKDLSVYWYTQILNLQDLLRKKNEEIQSLEVLKQSQVLKIETLELSASKCFFRS